MDTFQRRIRVIDVPPGEAPAWVREKWVGLELPIVEGSLGPVDSYIVGVLSGPRTLLGTLFGYLTGRFARARGFRVRSVEAIRILEMTSPDAGRWWRDNTPHLLQPRHVFMFHEYVVELVENNGDTR